MNEPTMETLARRLDKVERENRRLKQAGVVALGVIAAVLLMGQATQDSRIVEAEKFVLKDENGITRGRFGVAPDGRMTLGLLDEAGKTARLALALTRGGLPTLVLRDGAGRAIALGLQDGFPILQLADRDAETRASLYVSRKGTAGLEFYDKSGKVIWSAP